MTTDLRTQALTAVLAVKPANATSELDLRVHASKAVRDATGLGLAEIVPVVNWAIEQVKYTRIDRYRSPTTNGWRYEFPNGHNVSVINDPNHTYWFSVASAEGVTAGLTSEQVEVKLHTIAALPAI